MSRWIKLVFVLAATSALGARASVIFPSDTEWKYFPGRTEASAPGAWRTLDFDDSPWSSGQAPFYYDDQPTSATAYTGNTQLSDMRGNYTCIFMRKTFV